MATLIQQLENAAKAEKTPVQEQEPPRKTPKRSKRWLILSGALIVLAAAAGAAYAHYSDRVSTDDAQVDAHIAPVASKIFGNVAEILVDDNQTVQAGQILMRIDSRDYAAKVAQARAALTAAQSQETGARVDVPLVNATTASNTAAAEAQVAAAEADFARAKADYERASSSEIAMAKADIESKRATADRARADLNRMQPLAAQDEISQQQFDSYVAAARVADSDLNAEQQKLENAQRQALSSKAVVDASSARVAAARAALEHAQANREQVQVSSAAAGTASASVQQARANLEAAQLELSYTTIVAPVAGVVTKKNVQLGQIVQPGQSLMTIVPLSDVYVSANFKETQLAQVQPGQRAEIYIDMYGKSFDGVVDSISNSTGSRLSLLPAENATGNYVKIVQRIPVKIVVDHLPAGFTLRPGMNVEATIFTKQAGLTK